MWARSCGRRVGMVQQVRSSVFSGGLMVILGDQTGRVDDYVTATLGETYPVDFSL